MAINFDRFLAWAEKTFDIIKVKGNEVKVNSPFYEEIEGEKDYKCKLWCNPIQMADGSGGKQDIENGVFHCWRTGRKGSLVSLVMLIDKCSYEDALATLGAEDTSMAEIEAKLEEFFNSKPQEEVTLEAKVSELQLPPYTFLISDLSPSNFHRVAAEVYLFNRSLPIEGLMVCCHGDYRDRIVIPYYDREGKLIYYNARYIGNNRKIENERKYMGPPAGTSVLKSDVVYMPVWPENGSKVYYTEGEFDAKAIAKAGLFAGALGGKACSDLQILRYMQQYQPVIALDRDEAGMSALPVIGDKLLAKGIRPRYVLPPQAKNGVKMDWNKMLEKYGARILAAWLVNHEQPYDDDYSRRYKLQQIY